MKEFKRSEVMSPGSPRSQAYFAFTGNNSTPSFRSRTSRNYQYEVDSPAFHNTPLQSTSKLGSPTHMTSVPSVKIYSNVKSRYMDYLKKGYNKDDRFFKDTSMDWKKYHRLSGIHKLLDDLDDKFPSICSTGTIGSSLEGRDLKVLKISNSESKNASVWMDAGIHAREWIAPAVATYIANHIAANFNSLPPCVANKDWYFLPVMNPDGYEFSHTNTRLWRKNRAWHGGQCLGVDLNRNFSTAPIDLKFGMNIAEVMETDIGYLFIPENSKVPEGTTTTEFHANEVAGGSYYGWGGRGSSDDPVSPFYRGPEPFSEPESCAVRDMLIDSGVNFKVYITLHSYGQVILFPYACKDELCPDYVRLLEGGTAMSKGIFASNGNTYKVGVSKDIMYGASGTSNDWSYGEAKIPFCYLIELRSKKHKFKVPQEEIADTGNEILNGVFSLMEYVDNNSSLHNVQIRPTIKKRTSFGYSPAINIWKEEPSTMDILVEGPRAAQVAGMLHEREVPFSIAIGDVDAMKDLEQSTMGVCHSSRRGSASSRRIMDWKHYHRLDTIYAWMDRLISDFPYLCSVHVIGTSYEGREIRVLKISNGNPDNEGIWVDGAIHPREWISTAVVTYIADTLVHTFHKQAESVTSRDWYILPVLNPDGYEYTHTTDRMWRKNRSRYGECVGVDLNRNFSYGWGEKGEEGSSEDPGNIFYRGPQPFSEPETNSVKRAILDSDTEFKVFLSFHSYGEVIIFPWGYTNDPCPDYVELLEGGTAMAKAIYGKSGHTYKVGSTKDLMYYAAGTSIDWSYAVANIPYSYMVELRGKKHRFLLPKEEIISTGAEVWKGVLTLIDFVHSRCKATQA